ncbi:MAG: Minf_1886 family protein [Candidatus Omnitrophota bacterium]
MKDQEGYLKKMSQLLEKNSQYKFEAYSFLMSALNFTVKKLPKPRHVSGRELLEGIRDYAHEQFGPMARTVLNHWGITKTEDFGRIVFALVEAGFLRKQPEDKLEDFVDIYDFEEVFDRGYRIDDSDF